VARGSTTAIENGIEKMQYRWLVVLQQQQERSAMQDIENFLCEEEGASALEYALLASLITGPIILAVALFGGHVCALFASVNTAFTGAANPC
jgi:Flp pilus assembly pilin Flp